MQVAMIAQGEFMELLRAKSDDKKEIFRKLFHTELFQKIVEELKNRGDKLKVEISRIRTACQTEAAHIVVPEDYEGAEALLQLKERILVSERLNVADMELLLAGLKNLCEELEIGERNAGKACEEAGKRRDETRDAFNGAQSLLKTFEQLERAERALAECAAVEGEIGETVKLIARIQGAYEIQGAYQRLHDAEGAALDTERNLKEQQESLPELEAACEKTARAEAEAKSVREAELEVYTKVSERVKKALDILGRLRTEKKNVDAGEKELQAAETAEAQAREKLEKLEDREQEWKKQSEELRDADKILALWEMRRREADGIAAEMDAAQKAGRELEAQRKRTDKAQRDYAEARDRFGRGNAEYVAKQTAYLDAQAGFIARESLREGEPCPVCGSVDHPHPCALSAEHRELTREMIDALAGEAARLQKEQEDKAGEAKSAAEVLAEKTDRLAEMWEKLRERMVRFDAESMEGMLEDLAPERAAELISVWGQSLDAQKTVLQENADTFARVREALKNVDETKASLREAAEQAAQRVVNAKTALAGSMAALAKFEEDRDYPTEEAAEAALAAAAAARDRKDEAYGAAGQAAVAARQKLDRAKALIERYSRELPAQKEECDRRREVYGKLLTEKVLKEPEWMAVTKEHPRSETDSLQARVEEYHKKKANAEGMHKTAKETIGDRARPDIDKLESDRIKAEEELAKIEEELGRYRESYRDNLGAYRALAPKMEERGRIMQDYTRLDGLRRRLDGNVTDARMDIETFVQRYYLQRVLHSANARFRTMSAGQFELRMVGEEQAGKGRNRGLDLMVYSTVTDREREVRTLSGGESFMAALSLALGMADQIKESSAAVNLDIMFIDEGFGSLDEHSRGQAVRVLQQMAGGSRLIGIISHVTELKQEIEDQLLVSRDEEGSHVRWRID